jgi:hypothetical protein
MNTLKKHVFIFDDEPAMVLRRLAGLLKAKGDIALTVECVYLGNEDFSWDADFTELIPIKKCGILCSYEPSGEPAATQLPYHVLRNSLK